MNAADRIKQNRIQKGLSQADLAKKLRTTPQNISQYERGIRKPKLETLQKIAVALEIPAVELIDPVYDPAEIISRAAITVGAHTAATQNDLIQAFHRLNDEGQRVAVERVEELTEIPKYQKMMENDEPESKD